LNEIKNSESNGGCTNKNMRNKRVSIFNRQGSTSRKPKIVPKNVHQSSKENTKSNSRRTGIKRKRGPVPPNLVSNKKRKIESTRGGNIPNWDIVSRLKDMEQNQHNLQLKVSTLETKLETKEDTRNFIIIHISF